MDWKDNGHDSERDTWQDTDRSCIFFINYAQLNDASHGGMINRWPHQKTSTLDDVIARNGT